MELVETDDLYTGEGWEPLSRKSSTEWAWGGKHRWASESSLLRGRAWGCAWQRTTVSHWRFYKTFLSRSPQANEKADFTYRKYTLIPTNVICFSKIVFYCSGQFWVSWIRRGRDYRTHGGKQTQLHFCSLKGDGCTLLFFCLKAHEGTWTGLTKWLHRGKRSVLWLSS